MWALECWSKENQRPLDVKKCKVVTCPILVNYAIQRQQLQRVTEMRDLGVMMKGKLNYAKYFEKSENTTNK